MDIVFVLDGSVAVLEPSGRERMILAGLVESLRQWTLYAPLTGTGPGFAPATQTGFRVGVIKMGDLTYMCPQAGCRITGNVAQIQQDVFDMVNRTAAMEFNNIDYV